MKINWKYAVGEILIVIIGISLAFWLNSWNEGRVNASQQKQYLEQLILDINQEIVQLEKNKEDIATKLEDIKIIKPHLGNKNPGRDTIVGKVFRLARVIDFHPVSTTYQTLINSGDMKLIKDFQLRRSLEEHYALHKVVLLDYERIKEIHRKYLGDFFIYHVDFDAVYKGDSQFLDNPLIRNIMTSIEGAHFLAASATDRCLKSNKSLLQKIEKELGE